MGINLIIYFLFSLEIFSIHYTRASTFIFGSALEEHDRDRKQIGIKGDESKFFQDPTRFTFVAVN